MVAAVVEKSGRKVWSPTYLLVEELSERALHGGCMQHEHIYPSSRSAPLSDIKECSIEEMRQDDRGIALDGMFRDDDRKTDST